MLTVCPRGRLCLSRLGRLWFHHIHLPVRIPASPFSVQQTSAGNATHRNTLLPGVTR